MKKIVVLLTILMAVAMTAGCGSAAKNYPSGIEGVEARGFEYIGTQTRGVGPGEEIYVVWWGACTFPIVEKTSGATTTVTARIGLPGGVEYVMENPVADTLQEKVIKKYIDDPAATELMEVCNYKK